MSYLTIFNLKIGDAYLYISQNKSNVPSIFIYIFEPRSMLEIMSNAAKSTRLSETIY